MLLCEMISKPALVVFDLAGTTIEDNGDIHRMLKAVFREYHLDISLEEVNAVMGIPKPVAIRKLLLLHRYPNVTEEIVSDIHDRFVRSMIHFYRFDSSVKEKEGVSRTFSSLKTQGVLVAVDTGFNRMIARPLLERMGWAREGLLDFSVTSDEVPHGRPQPDLIHKAMKLGGISSPARVAKVGDTVSDVQEGKAAGCGWTIAISTGACNKVELLRESPTHLIEQIPEVLQIFGIE